MSYVDFFDKNFAHILYIGYTTTTVHLTELISYRDEAALYMTKNLDMSYAMDMIKKPVFQVIFFFYRSHTLSSSLSCYYMAKNLDISYTIAVIMSRFFPLTHINLL